MQSKIRIFEYRLNYLIEHLNILIHLTSLPVTSKDEIHDYVQAMGSCEDVLGRDDASAAEMKSVIRL